jgi:hypothetical protein
LFEKDGIGLKKRFYWEFSDGNKKINRMRLIEK